MHIIFKFLHLGNKKNQLTLNYSPPTLSEIQRKHITCRLKNMNAKLTQISTDGFSKISMVKMLSTIGSIISIGFGIWHFFIPYIWSWYSYFDKAATELVIAVRAINIFFSLLLVLLGIANILIVFRRPPERFSTIVILSISTVLWATRLVLQIIYPQGSQNPVIQYSMLSVFILVFICFLISLLIVFNKSNHQHLVQKN